MTITEALAELKTLVKRVQKKREFVGQYLGRSDGMRDPLAADGGSIAVLQKERQAMTDLAARLILIRTSIQKINQVTPITIEGVTRTIAEWLTWRKEVAPGEAQFYATLLNGIRNARQQALKNGQQIVMPGGSASQPADIIINLDESALAKDAEKLETILGALDGQLSLKNATVIIDV